jgi:hypothetical protein
VRCRGRSCGTPGPEPVAGEEAADREIEEEIVGGPAPDADQPVVLAALMMPGAECRQVPRGVRPLVGAVDDVVAVEVLPCGAGGYGAPPTVALEDLVARRREGDPRRDRVIEKPFQPQPRDHGEEEPRHVGRRPEVDLRAHLLLELSQRHRLVEGRPPQDRLGGSPPT